MITSYQYAHVYIYMYIYMCVYMIVSNLYPAHLSCPLSMVEDSLTPTGFSLGPLACFYALPLSTKCAEALIYLRGAIGHGKFLAGDHHGVKRLRRLRRKQNQDSHAQSDQASSGVQWKKAHLSLKQENQVENQIRTKCRQKVKLNTPGLEKL